MSELGLCDKNTKKSPCDGGPLHSAACAVESCPRVYTRCHVHGGLRGCSRSLRAHIRFTHDIPLDDRPSRDE